VEWKYEAPEGGGDTHYSLMRGTDAALVIRQGAEQNYRPTLYVEKRCRTDDDAFETALRTALAGLAEELPGLGARRVGAGLWAVEIPDVLREGHEAHFGRVTRRYLRCLAEGALPAWEVPNMITKYRTILRAYELSR
jgi:hypothetical protein